MRIDILTLFPGMFAGPFDESIVKRAIERGLVQINIHNIRDYTADKHHIVDDYPYGGGSGMVMKPEPIFAAVEAAKDLEKPDGRVVLMSPQGRTFSQEIAKELSQIPYLIIICGHYEGIDERVREHLVDAEISIGDFILTGGELPAMVVVDSVVRLLEGALGSPESAEDESFSAGLLEYPQYTRPAYFRGWDVPEVLLSGHHGEIGKWRRRQAILNTMKQRPDLLKDAKLTEEERRWLDELT